MNWFLTDEPLDPEFLAGGPDPTDEPVWSGTWMVEFFAENPIPIDEMTPSVANRVSDIIEEGIELSIPIGIFNELDNDYVHEDKAAHHQREILETLEQHQVESHLDAVDIVNALFDNDDDATRGDRWFSYFHTLYHMAAIKSFRYVNGYDYQAFTEVRDVEPIKCMDIDDYDFGGVYAFRCDASGYVKLGMSRKSIKSRVRGQLSSLPKGGTFIGGMECENPSIAEVMLHSHFGKCRINPRKEWFMVNHNDVVEYFEKNA